MMVIGSHLLFLTSAAGWFFKSPKANFAPWGLDPWSLFRSFLLNVLGDHVLYRAAVGFDRYNVVYLRMVLCPWIMMVNLQGSRSSSQICISAWLQWTLSIPSALPPSRHMLKNRPTWTKLTYTSPWINDIHDYNYWRPTRIPPPILNAEPLPRGMVYRSPIFYVFVTGFTAFVLM